MSRRRFQITGRRVVDVDELARAKYLDARRIKGSDYVVTDVLYRAPFPDGSAGLRAAAEKALLVELEASLANLKGAK